LHYTVIVIFHFTCIGYIVFPSVRELIYIFQTLENLCHFSYLVVE